MSGYELNKREMKKYYSVIYYLALIAFVACNGNKQQSSTGESKDIKQKTDSIKIETFELRDTCNIVEEDKNSPELTIGISLPVINCPDKKVEEKINKTIAIALLGEEAAENIPGQNSIPDISRRFASAIKDEYYDLSSFYLETIRLYGDNSTASFNHFYLIEGDAGIGYNGLINYVVNDERYTGGAHPYGGRITFNFDPKSGEEVTLDSFFKEEGYERLTELVCEGIARHFGLNTFEEVVENSYIFKEFENNMYVSNNFLLGKEKVTFIYNPYDISSYATGEINSEVPYDKLKEIMK